VTLPVFQVDAFTARAFAGNPAVVCFPGEPRDADWMQRVAREMHAAATAFVWVSDTGQTPAAPAAGAYTLRWFSPAVELQLCGHGTLSAAHVLWETREVRCEDPVHFQTHSGRLVATRRGDWIELDFPATPDEPAPLPPGLAEALGATPRYVGKSRFDYLVELDSVEAIRGLRPDFARLRAVPARGVIATSQADEPGVDFVSRFFAPSAGIDEDHVTGSAHCCLAPFWSRRLAKKSFVAHQLSSRGGVVKLSLDGDRVRLAGQAVTVMRGELRIA
jgi:PhzF family phenazine biosynthesis protein